MGNEQHKQTSTSNILVCTRDVDNFINLVHEFDLYADHITNSTTNETESNWSTYVMIGPNANLRNFGRFSANMKWIRIGIHIDNTPTSFWKIYWEERDSLLITPPIRDNQYEEQV